MNRRANIHQAKSEFSKLIARARSGEEIPIAKTGQPVAKLSVYDVPSKARAAADVAACWKRVVGLLFAAGEAEILSAQLG